MKKDNHILLNLTSDEFKKIEEIAQAEDRTITATARRAVIKSLIIDEIIAELEKYKEELKQDAETLQDERQRYYFKGGWININYCITKIKEGIKK